MSTAEFHGELVDVDWRLGVICATDHSKKQRELYVRVKFATAAKRSFWVEMTIPQFYAMLQELEKSQAALR